MTENAIELVNITKTFGDVVANDCVNLTVKKGEILALLGENGSGKTTLVNMLSGIYFPDSGEIFVNGERAVIRSPSTPFLTASAWCISTSSWVDVFTAAENVVLGLKGGVVHRPQKARRKDPRDRRKVWL